MSLARSAGRLPSGGIKYVPKKRSPKAAKRKSHKPTIPSQAGPIRYVPKRKSKPIVAAKHRPHKPTTPSQAERNRIAAERFRLDLLLHEIEFYKKMGIRHPLFRSGKKHSGQRKRGGAIVYPKGMVPPPPPRPMMSPQAQQALFMARIQAAPPLEAQFAQARMIQQQEQQIRARRALAATFDDDDDEE